MDYTVITAEDLKTLTKVVEVHMLSGWEQIGGIAVHAPNAQFTPEGAYSHPIFYQAIVNRAAPSSDGQLHPMSKS